MAARIQKGILTALLVLLLTYLLHVSSARYYWHDEVANLLYLSGHRPAELIEKLADGRPKTRAELHRFQEVNPDRGLADAVQSLALTSPQLPPLYLMVLWIWARLFGNAEWVLRGLSTGIWLGFLAAVYGLCWLLFTHQRTATLAVLLLAFSPRFLPLAVQVWEYGLYALLTALSSSLFLCALNNPQAVKRWLLYGISLTAGLYAHLFFVTVPLSHLVYLGISWRSYSKKERNYFFRTLAVAVLLFAPWLFLIWQSPSGIYAWAGGRWALTTYLSRWWVTATGLFDSLNLSGGLDVGVRLAISALLGLTVVSLLSLSKQRQGAFLLALMAVPFSFLLLLDVTFTMRYASVGRFYLPTLIALVVALAFWLSRLMSSSRPVRRWLGTLALSFVLTLEFLSVLPSATPEARYQGYGSAIPNAAVIVNRAEKPLVIGENWLNLLPLSHEAKAETTYLLLKTPEQFHKAILPADSSTLYLLVPSPRLQETVRRAGFRLHATQSEVIWQLQPQPASRS
jgi:uncharacterized membrane protein